jgi:hypothetical protein
LASAVTAIDVLAFALRATYSAAGCSTQGDWDEEFVWVEESM